MTARNHLAPFRESPRPWLVLARNAVPVVGVYALGWSSQVAVVEIWWDGVVSLGLLLAFATAAVMRDDPEAHVPPAGLPRLPRVVVAPLFWLLPFLILGIPYWFAFGAFHAKLLDATFWRQLPEQPGIWTALALVFVANAVEHLQRGYPRMTAAELRREGDWEIHMHLARVVALLMMLFFLPLGGIAPLALALSYVEIYPLRSLRFLGGHESLDPENRRRSLD